jgi:integrase
MGTQKGPWEMSRSYLTDSVIRSLRPQGEREELRDSVVPGLGLRVGSQRKVWFFAYPSPAERDALGKPVRRRLTLGKYPHVSLAQARAQAAKLRDQVQSGVDPAAWVRPAAPVRGAAFADVAEDYLERYAKVRKVTWGRDQRIIRKILVPAFGARPAESITAREVRQLLEGLTLRGPNAVLAAHTVFRRLLSWGVQRFDLPGNPARMVEPMFGKATRDRVLRPEEVRRIWWACSEQTSAGAALVRLRLATAQRGLQLCRLRVDQLEEDGADLWWNVPASETKTRKPYRVYLSPLAREILAERRPSARGLCLANPHGGVMNGRVHPDVMTEIRERSGVHDWQALDMRRTAATWMAQRGVSRFIVKRVLGHADRDITAVYDLYSYDKEVKAAVLTLEQAIRDAIGTESPLAPRNENGPAKRHERPARPRVHG